MKNWQRYSKITFVKSNLIIGIIFVVIIVAGVGLFIQQQSNQKSPLDNNQTPNLNSQKSTSSPTIQETPTPTPVQTPVQNSSQSGNIVTMSDGLKFQDLSVGTGAEAKSGDTVAVNYLGTLENGTKFDSSYDRNQPFITQIGVGQVIKGWDEGIPGMKVGGKRKLIIPPALGYGNQAQGPIPANSVLIFEVELVSIK